MRKNTKEWKGEIINQTSKADMKKILEKNNEKQRMRTSGVPISVGGIALVSQIVQKDYYHEKNGHQWRYCPFSNN